jgi:hypothetical protein
MRGFLAFAVCFTLLVVIWREHYVFFRRYGLQDTTTIWLNAALLFVTLFYVYPLKFVFNLVLSGLTGAAQAGESPAIEPGQVPTLFVIYGAGVIALYLLLALMYAHAYRKRGELELTPVETFDTRAGIVGHLLAAGIGLVSVLLAVTLPLRMVGLAGFAYFLFGPVMAVYGTVAGSRRRRIFEAPQP